MTVWHVVVETTANDGTIEVYDSVVLAHSERGARSSATRALVREGAPGAHSVEATQLDHRETGVVFHVKRGIAPPITKEFPW